MSPLELAPRIRVVALAAERAGRTAGVWIPADQDPDALEVAVNEVLAGSPFDTGEGAVIREYEGFGDLLFTGSESLTDISRLALLIKRYGPVFIEVLKRLYQGHPQYTGAAERIFAEHYSGAFASMAAWGEEFANRSRLECDELLQPYIDWAAFAVDAESEGHFTTITDVNGRVHAFGR
jgi:hypothetical protein